MDRVNNIYEINLIPFILLSFIKRAEDGLVGRGKPLSNHSPLSFIEKRVRGIDC